MSTLNIEVFDKLVVRLQENRNNDVEIIVSSLEPHIYPTTYTKGQAGGVSDEVVATIPHNRRRLVAEFLLSHAN